MKTLKEFKYVDRLITGTELGFRLGLEHVLGLIDELIKEDDIYEPYMFERLKKRING